MEQTIRVIVNGAKGRMGQEVVKAVRNDPTLELVGAVDRTVTGVDVGQALGLPVTGVMMYNHLAEALDRTRPDVMVDFTNPSAVAVSIDTAIEYGVRPVVGTTGINSDDLKKWDEALQEREIGGLVAPNFTIGAILMMKFAAMAARHLPHVEIVEMHHDRKLDAPSGTAMKTLEMIAAEREQISQGHSNEEEILTGSRGGEYKGMHVHSVRLPGYFAHQEVIFGGHGQILTIRHDSMSREAYMPGVIMGIQRVMGYTGMLYGLEQLLD